MDNFVFKGLPAKVLFGRGRLADLGDEIAALELSKVVVLTTPEQQALGEQVAAQVARAVKLGMRNG